LGLEGFKNNLFSYIPVVVAAAEVVVVAVAVIL
jgi:hypothetical protein